jgi:Flp pilus assembly protein TadG
MKKFIRKNKSGFARDENGGATVEFTIWVPFLVAFFLAIGEVAMIFYGQSRILQVAQDATREASIGRLQTEAAVSEYVSTRLSFNATVQNVVSKGVIRTAISVPLEDLAPFGFFTNLMRTNITVVAQQVAEY